jgi:hypothetical protein
MTGTDAAILHKALRHERALRIAIDALTRIMQAGNTEEASEARIALFAMDTALNPPEPVTERLHAV